MIFTTLSYFFFVTGLLSLYYFLDRKWQNYLLLVANFCFYAALGLKGVPFLVWTIGFDYWVGSQIAKSKSTRKNRILVAISISLNLAVLAFFKLPKNVTQNFTVFSVLPLGLSFYTFQSIGYVVDCYKKRVRPIAHLRDYALCLSFFPSLLSGPLERADNLHRQFNVTRRFDLFKIESGINLIVLGLFKKLFASDSIYNPIQVILHGNALGAEYWLICVLLPFRVYYDFSGYCDIARGTARLFGINVPDNFKPFWLFQRFENIRFWNKTVGQWFLNYVYASLPRSGSTFSKLRNLFFTVFCISIWHGINRVAFISGIYFGTLFVLLTYWNLRAKSWESWPLRILSYLGMQLVFFPVSTLLSVSLDSGDPLRILHKVLTDWSYRGSAWNVLLYCSWFLVPVMVYEGVQAWTKDPEFLVRQPIWVRIPVWSAILGLTFILGQGSQEIPFYYLSF